MEKLDRLEGGGCTPTHFHYIYHHVQSCRRYTLQLFLLYPYMYSVVCTHRLTFVFLSSTFFVGRIFRLISLCTLLWEWLAFIHTSLKQLSINILAKVHALFDISNIRPKYPEADFMNVDFHWGFWAWCLGFSDLRFLYGYLTVNHGKGGTVFSTRWMWTTKRELLKLLSGFVQKFGLCTIYPVK